MKLSTFVVAAAVHAQDNKTGKEKKGPGPKKPLPVTENGDSKANYWGDPGSSGTSCSDQGANVISSTNGYEGSVTIDNYVNDLHCYVNIGEECGADGVSVKFTHMAIETMNYYYNYDTYEYSFDDYVSCYDSVHFTWNEGSEMKQTEPQCGCLDEDKCKDYTNLNDNFYDWPVLTEQPHSYDLSGSNAKIVFYTDYSVNGGKFTVDWKCNSPPPSWNICPSNHDQGGCYTQDKKWAVGEEVSCEMTNSDCLSVSCSAGGIKASFRADLFHTNLENEDSFMQQLKDGHRTIEFNGAALEKGGECGYTTTSKAVVIDWDYGKCGVSPIMVDDQIVYSVSLSSPGNAPGYETIEFYVDTAVDASCAYDSKVVIDADGFWVNQEDVDAAADAMGKFDGTFDCKFYDDANYQNQILSNNIVNMGEMIYGQVSSTELAGLSYELVGVTVTNANDEGMSYAVIDDGVPSPDVKASSDGSALTGQSVNFSYLSFGFESASGTNQNAINIQCAVDLFIA